MARKWSRIVFILLVSGFVAFMIFKGVKMANDVNAAMNERVDRLEAIE